MATLISATAWVPIRAARDKADWTALKMQEDRPCHVLAFGWAWVRIILVLDKHDLKQQWPYAKPKPKRNPSVSKYDYPVHNSPEQTALRATLRRGSRSSGRKITLPKLDLPEESE